MRNLRGAGRKIYSDKERSRLCRECGKITIYLSIESKRAADRRNCYCRSCAAIICLKDETLRKKHGEVLKAYWNKINRSGANNPFFGKKHSEKTKEKLRAADKSYTKTEKFRQIMKKAWIEGRCIPNRTPVYEIWVNKYGIDRANELDQIRRRKWSMSSSGSSNPMYGKPAPQGAGCGYSGWYKDWYFRSLRELSIVIDYFEPHFLEWKSAGDIRIPYIDYCGRERTYSPDFLVENFVLIEIKPERLQNTPLVLLKKNAAEKYCSQHSLWYQVADPPLNLDRIVGLYRSGKVRFLDKYDRIFKEKYSEAT